MNSWAIEQRKLGDVKPLLKYLSVKSWILSHKESARKNALYRFAAFVRWRRKNNYSIDPDEWIEECLNGNNMTLVKHLKVLKEWVEGPDIAGCKDITLVKYYRNVRSFYSYNLVSLPKSKLNARKKENEIPVNVTAIQFLEMMKKVLNSKVSLMVKSLMLVMLQGGMDDSTFAKVFNFVGFPQLVKHFGTEDWTKWDENNVPVRIDLMRPKTDYYYYTFLGHDAIMLLKDWLNYRTSRYGRVRIKPNENPSRLAISEPIFVNTQRRALKSEYVSVTYNRAGKVAGVNVVPEGKLPRYKGSTRRYPFHAHEVRDTLVTLGRPCGVDREIVNFFIGHDIDAQKYDKSPWDDPEHFKEQYKKLSKYLNVLTGKEALLKEGYERKLEGEIRKRDTALQVMQERMAALEKDAQEFRELMQVLKRSPSGKVEIEVQD